MPLEKLSDEELHTLYCVLETRYMCYSGGMALFSKVMLELHNRGQLQKKSL